MAGKSRWLLSLGLSHRRFLTALLGLGATTGSVACLQPLPGPGRALLAPTRSGAHRVDVRQVSHGSAQAGGVRTGRLPEAPEPTWSARDPAAILTASYEGRVSRLPGGQTLREYTLVAGEVEIEVAKGVRYPAWAYNGSVPGPTIRCTEGDRVKVYFHNEGGHPHSIHFHGIHPAAVDGVFEQVAPGGSYVYEFDADPFGLFLYHCHTMPGKKHIEKGLYGAFIVDPREPRPPARELVMVMNGFDTDLDGENEFYTVNGIASFFLEHPIELGVGEQVRIYLVNMTEFDLINSFHLHGNVFKLFRTGTRLDLYEITDTVTLGQGERAILEFAFKYPGRYLFHAHQSEFAELGWVGLFDVKA